MICFEITTTAHKQTVQMKVSRFLVNQSEERLYKNVNNLEIETRANVITSFCLMNESINQVKQIRFPLKL